MKKRKREETEKMKDEAEIFSRYIKRVLSDPKFGLSDLKHCDVYDTILKTSSAKNEVRLGRISSYNFSSNASKGSYRNSMVKDRISSESKKNESVKFYIRNEGDDVKGNNLQPLVERL